MARELTASVPPGIPLGKPPRRVSWLAKNWVWVLPLVCMVASEYKMRRRLATQAISGQADLQTIIEIMIYGAVAAWLILRPWTRWPRVGKPPFILAVVWVYGMLLMVSTIYAPYPTLAIARGVQFLILCGLCTAIYRHARLVDIHRLTHAYVVLTAASVIFGFVHKYPPIFKNKLEARRFNFFYVHPVVVGTYLGIAVVILFVYLREPALRRAAAWGWPIEIYLGLFGINVLGLVLTKTRGAIGGAIAGILLVLFLNTSPKRKQGVLLVMLALSPLAAIAFGKSVIVYLQRGETAQQLATLNSRTKLWGRAWEFFQARPLTGYGLGATRGIFLDSTSNLGGGHNALINVMTDLGLPGLLAWLTLLIGVVVIVARFHPGTFGHRDRLLIFGMLTFMVVNGLTYEGLGSYANSQALWLLVMVGWIGALRRTEKPTRAARVSPGPALPPVTVVRG